MKTKAIILLLLLVGINRMYSQTPEPITPGPHGGLVKATENSFCIEMVNSRTLLHAYLLDKCWNPIENTALTCEVRYLFPDGKEITRKLVPAGKDGFRTEESVTDFSSCLITFVLHSRELSVRFNNEEAMLGMK